MRADFLLRKLRAKGVLVSLLEGDRLMVKGQLDPDEYSALVKCKPDIVAELARNDHPGVGPDWASLRKLGSHLGEIVYVDGQEVVLWGLSPRGAAVQSASLVIGVDLKEVTLAKEA